MPFKGADPGIYLGGVANQVSQKKVESESRIESNARVEGAKRLRIESKPRTEGVAQK